MQWIAIDSINRQVKICAQRVESARILTSHGLDVLMTLLMLCHRGK